MRLLEDEWNSVYVWVDDTDENLELSPHFDYEEDAIAWFNKMKSEINNVEL